MIAVIDYGMGNLHSLGKSLERVAGSDRVQISYDPEKLLRFLKQRNSHISGLIASEEMVA